MKYSVGDYLKRPESVLLRIEIALDQCGMPVYYINNPKENSYKWLTEYELSLFGFNKAEPPDYTAWEKAQPGDMVRTGSSQYAKILLRLNDMVLVSGSPLSHKEREKHDKLAQQIKELGEEAPEVARPAVEGLAEALGVDDYEQYRRPLTGTAAYDSVITGLERFLHIHDCARFDWRLLNEVDGD